MPAEDAKSLVQRLISEGYRRTLKQIADSRKDLMGAQRASYQKLADACGMQKSYLSKVFGEAAHLSDDQLFEALEYLRIGADLAHLFRLQHSIERAGSNRRRESLQKQLNDIVREQSRTEKSVSGQPQLTVDFDYSKYYGEPQTPLVHMFLMVPRFAQNINLLPALLGISRDHLDRILNQLVELGIVAIETTGKIRVVKDHLHLPKESDLQTAFQTFIRLKSLERIARDNIMDSKDFRYAVNFTANPATQAKVVELFKKFMMQASEIIRGSPSDEVYQMVFDLNHIS